MCVIICKPRGQPLPSDEVIRKCFTQNSDGFGLAFNSPNDMKVTIRKGAMTLPDAFRMIKAVPKPQDRDMILHFRIATQGKVAPQNCHPFPLTSKVRWLKELALTTPVAIAHNGVINIKEDGTKGFQTGGKVNEHSDTQLFVQYYLSGLGTSLLNKQVGKLIEGFAGGRFAILTHQGIRTLGDFTEKGGLLYSNTLWEVTYHYKGNTAPLHGACDFCGRMGELRPIIPYLYACRFCHLSLGLDIGDFTSSSFQGGYQQTKLLTGGYDYD